MTFSNTDMYPETIEGHLEYIEQVAKSVRNAAEARRNQNENRYEDVTLTSMLPTDMWSEALKRAEALAGTLPDTVVERVIRVFRNRLTLHTVKRTSRKLSSAVDSLYASWDTLEATGQESSPASKSSGIADHPQTIYQTPENPSPPTPAKEATPKQQKRRSVRPSTIERDKKMAADYTNPKRSFSSLAEFAKWYNRERRPPKVLSPSAARKALIRMKVYSGK